MEIVGTIHTTKVWKLRAPTTSLKAMPLTPQSEEQCSLTQTLWAKMDQSLSDPVICCLTFSWKPIPGLETGRTILWSYWLLDPFMLIACRSPDPTGVMPDVVISQRERITLKHSAGSNLLIWVLLMIIKGCSIKVSQNQWVCKMQGPRLESAATQWCFHFWSILSKVMLSYYWDETVWGYLDLFRSWKSIISV